MLSALLYVGSAAVVAVWIILAAVGSAVLFAEGLGRVVRWLDRRDVDNPW